MPYIQWAAPNLLSYQRVGIKNISHFWLKICLVYMLYYKHDVKNYTTDVKLLEKHFCRNKVMMN